MLLTLELLLLVLYRSTVDLSVDAAVAITASHNPLNITDSRFVEVLYQWPEKNCRN